MSATRAAALSELSLRARFKQLTELDLPAHARLHRWPLRLDHCFKRVCLDWACGGCWYGHIARPAEQHLAGDTLRRAVQCAEDLLTGGLETLTIRNQASLRWRGKPIPALAHASEPGRERQP